MLNRNAEALFWVGRYLERAENHARLIDVHYHLRLDGETTDSEHSWARIIDALGARNEYLQQYETFSEQSVLSFITLDRQYENSLFSCVTQARSNLRTLREKLPSELWDVLNRLYLWLSEKKKEDIIDESPHPIYRQVKERAALFLGMQQSVMLRENEWHFIESGRNLERAENTIRILQSVLLITAEKETVPYPYWLGVLKSVSGYQAFRRYYADDVSVEPIMEFLVSNHLFPRSVHFAISCLEDHLVKIEPGEASLQALKEKAIRAVVKMRAELACLEREDLSQIQLGSLLESLAGSCRKLGYAVETAFFRFEEATA